MRTAAAVCLAMVLEAGLIHSAAGRGSLARVSGGPVQGSTADGDRGPGGLHFEPIGSEGGPLSPIITALYQDRSGFLWIGSRDGLTLHDGHTFTIFEHDASDPASISDSSIRAVSYSTQASINSS